MTASKGLRMKQPVHPGRFVREMILDSLGQTVSEAARALGVTRVALSRLVNEQASLSPEMAIRLDKAFGADMETLMRMQNSYDIAKARERQGAIQVAPFQPRTAAGCRP